VAAFHLRHGTTSLCPTTITRPAQELTSVVAACAQLPDDPSRARLLGVHLEGPFLNEERRGAQPAFTRLPDPELTAAWLAAGPVAVVTLAPELEGAESLIRQLRAAGVRVSLGHSACSYAQAAAGFAAGAGGVTHLFNAMSGLRHRRPGLAAAALDPGLEGAEERFHELILDTHHVHPALFRMAHRAARAQFNRVALTVIETDGLHIIVALQRPSQRDGRVLPTREQHQRFLRIELAHLHPSAPSWRATFFQLVRPLV